jgi:hypothetical protein
LRDRKDRSLRDFDLRKRLFRYPLSYMIYGRQVEALPRPVRERLFLRLQETLRSDRVAEADRRAIFEILRDTRPELGVHDP